MRARAGPLRLHGPQIGLLLVHGLADTPFIFRDLAEALAEALAERCVRVRAILLPGHGTRPGDLVTKAHPAQAPSLTAG